MLEPRCLVYPSLRELLKLRCTSRNARRAACSCGKDLECRILGRTRTVPAPRLRSVLSVADALAAVRLGHVRTAVAMEGVALPSGELHHFVQLLLPCTTLEPILAAVTGVEGLDVGDLGHG